MLETHLMVGDNKGGRRPLDPARELDHRRQGAHPLDDGRHRQGE